MAPLRHLPDLASLVLVGIIAKILADLVWAAVPQPASSRWQPPPAVTTRPVAKAGVDLAKIANAELFGSYTAPAEPEAVALEDAPDTQLNLTLIGVLSNELDEKDLRARALIAAQGGPEAPYSVGDDVTRGVQLTAIFPDRVILMRAGKPETLRLDKDAVGAPPAPSPLTEVAPTNSTLIDGDAAESLAAIRDELLSDPSKVSRFIRVQPVNTGNGLSGYRIYPGRDRAIFTAAGLRPGDVVTSVNGVPLSDPAQSLQMLSDLSSASQLNLTIDRGGQPQNLSLSLE